MKPNEFSVNDIVRYSKEYRKTLSSLILRFVIAPRKRMRINWISGLSGQELIGLSDGSRVPKEWIDRA